MTLRQVWLNLGVLGLLTALLALVYWQHTGVRAVPELIEDLRSEDAQRQMLAAEGLKTIGPEAALAVVPLVTTAVSTSSLSVSQAAAGALPPIDLSAARQVMATWLPKLTDADHEVRRDAAAILGALGPVAAPAVPALLSALDDSDTLVRERATRALGAIGLPIDAVMPGLLRALHDPEWTVRHAAVSQLSFGGFSSPETLTALHELTKDDNQTIAQLAQLAVTRPEREPQAATYTFMLQHETGRVYSLHQLAKLGPRAAEALPTISATLSSDRPLERYLAVRALEAIGRPALTALTTALQDNDPIVRDAALQAVRKLGESEQTNP